MEDRKYEDEISLKELINILLKNWKLIAGITLIAGLIGGIYAWGIASPVYESKVRGSIDIPEEVETKYGPFRFNTRNNMDYLSVITSDRVLLETIRDLSLDTTPDSLENRITVNNKDESNTFTFTVTSDTPETARSLMLTLRNNFMEETSYINKEKAINYFIRNSYVLLQSHKEKEDYLINDIANTEELLKEIKPTIVLQKSVLDDPLIAATIMKNNKLSFEELSNEMMLVEEINPNYVEVENQIILLKQELKDLSLEKDRNQRFNDELNIEKANLSALRWTNAANSLNSGLLDIMSSVIIIDENPSIPINPIAPRKMLILAISLVLGLMVGVFTAFFKAYWKEAA